MQFDKTVFHAVICPRRRTIEHIFVMYQRKRARRFPLVPRHVLYLATHVDKQGKTMHARWTFLSFFIFYVLYLLYV